MPPAGAHASITSLIERGADWFARPRPVRTLLLAMSIALIVPGLAFTSYLVARSLVVQRTQAEQRLVQAARALGLDVDRELQRMLAILDALSQSESLARGDFATFYRQASAAVQRVPASIIVLDPSMQMLVNTGVPYGTPLPKTIDPASAQRVLDTRKPYVSDLFLGRLVRQWSLNVLVPAPSEQDPRYVLILVVSAKHWLALLDGLNLPEGWISGLTDRHGTIITRSMDHDAFVGKPLPAPLVAASRQNTGAFSTINIEGVRTIRAVARSSLSDWTVSVNLPRSAVDAEVRSLLLALATGGMGLLILALTLASMFARWIIDPMRELAASAVTLEDHTIPAPLVSPVTEANEVASALRFASVELKSRIERLSESERRLNLAQRTAGLAYVDFDLTRQTITASNTFEEMFGVRPPPNNVSEAMRAFVERIHPQDRDRVRAAHTRAIQTPGDFAEDEFRVTLPDGGIQWISTQWETFADLFGQPIRVLMTNLDITRRKQHEEHITFLLREVSHRSKNLMAVIQAMAKQTARARQSHEEFQTRFAQRLQGIAASQDLLVNQNWQGIEVASLVKAQLQPFADEKSGRLVLSGGSLLLNPEAAQSIGLALHELATNATKYGALSVPRGQVKVSWETSGRSRDARFRMRWRERGGLAAAAPDLQNLGFGHTVFKRMIEQALGAAVELTYSSKGLTWALDAELSSVTERE